MSLLELLKEKRTEKSTVLNVRERAYAIKWAFDTPPLISIIYIFSLSNHTFHFVLMV